MTDRYAVIGNPVAHSLSPPIHRVFAAATGQDLTYEGLFAEDFRTGCDGFFKSGGRGLNVTLPFKPDAYRWVDQVDDGAREARAVNTIVAGDNGFKGYNTDGVGLLRDLGWNLSVDVESKRVLVLGAGGAVRGVLGPLLRARPSRLMIANRTASKAEILCREFKGVESAPLDALDETYDIVINGTSAGMHGEGALVDAKVVEAAFCYDMFYVLGGDTPFCRWSRERGAAGVAGGLGMLIEQAAESFHLWRGVRPPTAGIEAALADR